MQIAFTYLLSRLNVITSSFMLTKARGVRLFMEEMV